MTKPEVHRDDLVLGHSACRMTPQRNMRLGEPVTTSRAQRRPGSVEETVPAGCR